MTECRRPRAPPPDEPPPPPPPTAGATGWGGAGTVGTLTGDNEPTAAWPNPDMGDPDVAGS